MESSSQLNQVTQASTQSLLLNSADVVLPRVNVQREPLEFVFPKSKLSVEFRNQDEVRTVVVTLLKKPTGEVASFRFGELAPILGRELATLLQTHPGEKLFCEVVRLLNHSQIVPLIALQPLQPAFLRENEQGWVTKLSTRVGPTRFEHLPDWLQGIERKVSTLVQLRDGCPVAEMRVELINHPSKLGEGIIFLTERHTRSVLTLTDSLGGPVTASEVGRKAFEIMELFMNEGAEATRNFFRRDSGAEAQSPNFSAEKNEGGAFRWRHEDPAVTPIGTLHHLYTPRAVLDQKTLESGVLIRLLEGKNDYAIHLSVTGEESGHGFLYTVGFGGLFKGYRESTMREAFQCLISEDPKRQRAGLAIIDRYPYEGRICPGSTHHPIVEMLGIMVKTECEDTLAWRWPSRLRGIEKESRVLSGYEHAIVAHRNSPPYEFSLMELSLDQVGNGTITLRNLFGYEIKFKLPSINARDSDDIFERKQYLKSLTEILAESPQALLDRLFDELPEPDLRGMPRGFDRQRLSALNLLGQIYCAHGRATGMKTGAGLQKAMEDHSQLDGTFQVFFRNESKLGIGISLDSTGIRSLVLCIPSDYVFGEEQYERFNIPESLRAEISFDRLMRSFHNLSVLRVKEVRFSNRMDLVAELQIGGE